MLWTNWSSSSSEMLKASYGLVIGKDIYNGKELIIKNKLNQIFFIPFYSNLTVWKTSISSISLPNKLNPTKIVITIHIPTPKIKMHPQNWDTSKTFSITWIENAISSKKTKKIRKFKNLKEKRSNLNLNFKERKRNFSILKFLSNELRKIRRNHFNLLFKNNNKTELKENRNS